MIPLYTFIYNRNNYVVTSCRCLMSLTISNIITFEIVPVLSSVL